MKKWHDLGNGQWRLTVAPDSDLTAVSNFTGTRDEIMEKLADSQANANARIKQLRPPGSSAPTPQTSPTRPLTPEERLATVVDLQSAATVDKGITRVLESAIGPLEEFNRDRQADREQRRIQAAENAALQFFESTPDWYASEHNKATMTRYVFAQRLDPTKVESYRQAFTALTEAQLLQTRPAEDETITNEPAAEQGRNAPTPTQRRQAPTRSSTSIRQSDISGTAPRPQGIRLKYSREQLANLSASDYKRLMQSDRAELERCEAYYAKNPVRRAS